MAKNSRYHANDSAHIWVGEGRLGRGGWGEEGGVVKDKTADDVAVSQA